MWKIEVIVSDEKTARALLALIMSDAVAEMLEQNQGEILSSATFEEKEEENDQD